MAYTQEYVNQLIQEAAAQAGGSLSYADVANAAANLGIPLSQVDAAMSAGAPVYEDVSHVSATDTGTLSKGVTDQQVLQWFQDNPGATDAQIAQAAAAAGVSASQLSRVTGVPVSEVVSRIAATNIGTLSAPEAAPNVAVAAPKSLVEQLLSQGTTDKWSGEGFGSAAANAADMAKILAGIGITDLSQFGQFEQKGTRQETVIPEYSDYGYDSPQPTGRYYIPQYTLMGDGDVMTGKTYVDPSSVYGGQIGSGDSSYSAYFTDVPITQTVYGNKETGQALPNTYGERQTGNAWGGTYAGEGNTAYRVQFDAQGNPIFYTTGASSSDIGDWAPLLTIGSLLVAPGLSGLIGGATGLTGGALAAATGATLGAGTAALTGNDILKGALVGGGTAYLGNTLFGGGNTTGLGMNSNLTMAQIESGLGTAGYGYNAGAANSGLFNAGTIGSGAYTQTSYPYDMSEFLAADALNLSGQVGSNIPAIEQNLIASGVDPLVAADVANQVTLNPNISTYDLTNYINTNFGGGSLYDVNTATQYPTSVLKNTGGLLTDIPASTTTAADYSNEGRNYPTTSSTQGAGGSPVNASTAAAAGLTASQIANLIKAGMGLLGTGAVANAVGGTGGVGALPTQGVPVGNQDYYNAIQQYYNSYMPAAPRDVATPLQNWYNSKYGA